MPSRIAKTKRPRTVTQRKNGHTVTAAKVKTPVGIPSNLARVLRPQAAFRWRGPNLSQYTPTYIEGVMSGAMAGSHSQQWELFKMMFDTWPELSSCKQELTYGLMKKNLIFEPYHDEDEKPSDSAVEKSKVVSAALRQMAPAADKDENALEGTISDILNGWFVGVTMLEILWNVIDVGPLGLIQAPRTTFIVDPMYYAFSTDGTIGLRELDRNGAPYPSSNPTFNPSSQSSTRLNRLPPHKFLVGIHKATSGSALAGSLLRPLAWWWCAANFASDWMLNLAQVFGLPFRWATFEQNATPETKDALAAMLQNMGSSGWAMFPAGTEMELKTPPGGNSSDHSPQGELLDRADRYCRALILGQTMSGGSGTTGKGGGQAFGTVEEGVKDDRIDAAGRYVSGVLNQQLIKSILMLNYGETSESPSARFLEDAEAELAEAQRDQTLVSMGVPMGVDYVRKKYDVPEPADDEEILSGMSTGQKEADAAKTELLKQGMDQKAQDLNQKGKAAIGGAPSKPDRSKPSDTPAKASEGIECSYNPEQPREPAGSETGGEWTSDGGVTVDLAKIDKIPGAPKNSKIRRYMGPIGGILHSKTLERHFPEILKRPAMVIVDPNLQPNRYGGSKSDADGITVEAPNLEVVRTHLVHEITHQLQDRLGTAPKVVLPWTHPGYFKQPHEVQAFGAESDLEVGKDPFAWAVQHKKGPPPMKSKDSGDDLDFYLGDLREEFIRAFKGDLTPLRGALEIALAKNTEVEQREALIALQPKLPELLKTFIDRGTSPEILAKTIAKGFSDGWQAQKTA